MVRDAPTPASRPGPVLPPDDPRRHLALAKPDEDGGLRHVAVAGDTYTVPIGGADTAGRYGPIDVHVPPGGGPPAHRHDFEGMSTVPDGEIEITFAGRKGRRAGRPDRRHPGRRAVLVHRRLRCVGAAAVHGLARRFGRVLLGRHRPRRGPDGAAARVRPGRMGGAAKVGRGLRAAVSDRVAETLRGAGGSALSVPRAGRPSRR